MNATITVISPNGGESWSAGSTQTISWTYEGNPGYGVKIELLKGGVLDRTISYYRRIGSSGTGSYNWRVPTNQASGTDYQVRVTSRTNGSYTDTSDSNFTVVGTPPPSITVASPNGGESWAAGSTQTISWTYEGNPGYGVKIELLKGGVLDRTISYYRRIGSSGTGSYIWTVPTNQASGSDYQVRVTSRTNGSYTDTSDGTCTVVTVQK